MPVSYSTIKAASEPEAIADLLATRVIGPVMPSVVVKKVRPKSGRRYEAPRVLWNVYEAELELSGGIPATSLIWTKAFFTNEGSEEYQQRIRKLLASQNGNPLDPHGYVQFFSDLNLFLFFFPTDPVFPKMASVFDPQHMAPGSNTFPKSRASSGTTPMSARRDRSRSTENSNTVNAEK